MEWLDRFIAYTKEVEAEIQAIRPEAYIEVVPRSLNPSLRPETDGEAEVFARQITGDNATHVVSYGTEAGQFQRAGYSVVVCGPGDIAQAHQPNEFIEISQLDAGVGFIANIIRKLS